MPEPRIVESTHRDGWPHARSTVRRMAGLAREAAQSYEIRSLATAIVQDVPSKQTTAELAALYRWVRDSIRYRFDPVGIEWLQSPSRTLAEGAGDCDDLATLLAALAESLGHETRYHVVGPDAQTPKHVAVEAWDGAQWVTLDPVLEPPAQSTQPREDLGEFGRRAEGHIVHFDNSGSQLGSYRQDYELWAWRPLAYTDSGLLVPVHPEYAGDFYNYPAGTMPDAVRPAGIVGARFTPSGYPPCIALPRGMMGSNCTCPVSDRTYGLGYWVNTGLDPMLGNIFEDAWEWGKNAVKDIGQGFEDGWEWAKNAVDDAGSWLAGAWETLLDDVLKPIADATIFIAELPGVEMALTAILPNGAMVVKSAKQWAYKVQELADKGATLDEAAAMAYDQLPPDMKASLDQAPAAMAQLQNLDTSVLVEAGLDPDMAGAIDHVRGTIPPDIDFNEIANQLEDAKAKSSGGASASAAAKPANDSGPKITARAAVGPPIKKVAESVPRQPDDPPPEPAQIAPVPSDSDPLVQFTHDVIGIAQTDPAEAAEMIESGIHFAMSSAFPRQKYDAQSGIFRIFAPVLSGLGASPPRSEDIRELAFQAGMRVAEIIDETGRPPSVPVPEVADFQRAADTPDDGLWGPNTQLAASYYLEMKLDEMPDVHRAFAGTPTTWEPPEGPEPAPEPTLRPTAVAESVPREPGDPPPPEPEPDVIDVTGPKVVAESVPREPGDPPPPEPEPEPEPPPPPEPAAPPPEPSRPVIDVTGPQIVEASPPPEPAPSPPEPPPAAAPSGSYREVGTSPVDPGLPELDTGEVVPSERRAARGSGAWPLLLAWIAYEHVY